MNMIFTCERHFMAHKSEMITVILSGNTMLTFTATLITHNYMELCQMEYYYGIIDIIYYAPIHWMRNNFFNLTMSWPQSQKRCAIYQAKKLKSSE